MSKYTVSVPEEGSNLLRVYKMGKRVVRKVPVRFFGSIFDSLLVYYILYSPHVKDSVNLLYMYIYVITNFQWFAGQCFTRLTGIDFDGAAAEGGLQAVVLPTPVD